MKREAFQRTVWKYYENNGRHHLPWRQTDDVYRILVSELMLQQTQVDRVIPKYQAFIKKWPNSKELAKASLAEVLVQWQGLGYNRRAKFLHETTKIVESEYDGIFPKTEEELLKLPGIGPYTAKAICAFAFNKLVVLIETNVRQVFIHHFFKEKESVTDKEILQKVEETLPTKNTKEWYAALMDYGTYLKKEFGNNTKKSSTYKKQSRFKGSAREVRGAILRFLSTKKATNAALQKALPFNPTRIDEQLKKLLAEEMVVKNGKNYTLPT